MMQPPPPPRPTRPPPSETWMSMPKADLSNCPPGLEYLSMIDQLLVHQQIEVLEVVTGFDTQNIYKVKNILGEKVYYAKEESGCCARLTFGTLRPFNMQIFDNFRHEVIRLERPLACNECCFPCCLQRLVVSAPPGTVVGTVEQQWSLCKPKLVVKNASQDVVLTIRGPCWHYSCGGDINFDVCTKDWTTKVGVIAKQWTGLQYEAFTNVDNFGITFPMDLDVRTKAVLLGACLLVDFMYFESPSIK